VVENQGNIFFGVSGFVTGMEEWRVSGGEAGRLGASPELSHARLMTWTAKAELGRPAGVGRSDLVRLLLHSDMSGIDPCSDFGRSRRMTPFISRHSPYKATRATTP
jgi:hypothetical protein